MARRGGAARLVTGNPLGGMLRDLNRQTRRTTRRSGAPRPVPPEGGGSVAVSGPVVLPPLPGAAPYAAVVVTGEDGRARWTYPAPLPAPPVLTALPVDPDPGDEDTVVTAVLEVATATEAVVRVWRTRPRRGAGVAAPAGEGVHVHLTAVPPGR
ncbi:hypothetical protein [Streptomyces fuscigenes]|uniref:hypothetical protein n=1 Tax=Streptomyces fuscigenes TaxID=1528880 RepID=UPI001F375135|nr:hypothetical protein [Streptomyces fuscigenes]MCF3960603.1 hypothetical protein [Streptomyces fuscigenes]